MPTQNSNEVRISTETVVKTFATVVINGEVKGKREINGTPTLLSFATSLAQEFGINSFVVNLNDQPVTDQAQANAPLPADATVAVAAKDARGWLTNPEVAGFSPIAEMRCADEDETAVDLGDEHVQAEADSDETDDEETEAEESAAVEEPEAPADHIET